jgi:16S rRNA (cytosine967-C5)-methyltransferase
VGRHLSGRDQAFRILCRVETADAYATILLRAIPTAVPGREKSLANELVMGTLRWQARIDHALEQFADRPMARVDPPLRVALRLGAYQILHLDRIPTSAAVNESVVLARRSAGRGAGGYVNAVLRALGRGTPRWPAPEADPAERLAIELSHPVWLVRRWVRALGVEETEALLRRNNQPSPTTLRVNRLVAGRDDLAKRLASEGVETEPGRWSPDALRVRSGSPSASPAFRDGWFYFQDEASQLVAALVGAGPGDRVADLCAAPGGKATDLAARVGDEGWVLAADRTWSRLQLVRSNAERLGMTRLRLVVGEASRPGFHGRPFDRVLVDAPCSGTGVLRRHPEIRWRRVEDDIDRLARLQAELLDGAAGLVRDGGTLVYSVCSLEPEEGREAVERFLSTRSDFAVADPPAGLPSDLLVRDPTGTQLRTLPHPHDLDGFFAVAMTRTRPTDDTG